MNCREHSDPKEIREGLRGHTSATLALKVDFAVCIRVAGDKIAEENGYGFSYGLMPQLTGQTRTAVTGQP